AKAADLGCAGIAGRITAISAGVKRGCRPRGISVQIELVSRLPADAPVVAVGAFEGKKLTQAAASLDRQLAGRLRKAMAGGRFTGAPGQSLDLVAPAGFAGRRVLLVGLGKAGGLNALAAQDVGGRIENLLAGMGEAEAVVALDLAGDLPA